MLVSTYQERLQTTYSEIALLNYSNQSRPQCPYTGTRPQARARLGASRPPQRGCRARAWMPLLASACRASWSGGKRGALQQQVLSTVRLRTSLKQCFKIPVSYAAARNSECSLCRRTGKPYGWNSPGLAQSPGYTAGKAGRSQLPKYHRTFKKYSQSPPFFPPILI